MIDESAQAKILQADLSNIVRKVKAGKVLSRAERETIQADVVKEQEAKTPAPQADAKPSPLAKEPRTSDKISTEKLLALLATRNVVLSGRRLRQLAKEKGLFPEPVGEQYQSAQTLLGLVQHYHDLYHTGSGELEAEQLRKLKEEADRVALENEKTRGNLVEIEAVYKHFEGVFVGLRARVLASGLIDQEKDELLDDLRRLKTRNITKRDRPGDDSPPADGDTEAAAAAECPGMG